jgi:hypothetical protein
MSNRINDFIGVQAVLRQQSQSKGFEGWVAHIERGSVTIRAAGCPTIVPGSRVHVELSGRDNIASFDAVFVKNLAANYDVNDDQQRILTELGVIVDADQIEYIFYIASEVQFKSPTGSFRVDAEGLFLSAGIEGRQAVLEMRDIGETSFSAFSELEIKVGSAFECKIQGPSTCIIGAAQIQSCKTVIPGKQYVVEGEFDPSCRIDAGRWRTLIRNPRAA